MSDLSRFAKRWGKGSKGAGETIGSAVKGFFNPQPPLREQLTLAMYKIGNHIARLDHTMNKLKYRDQQLFNKVVEAYQKGEMTRAKMYANEVAEIRKVGKQIMIIRHVLERIKLRLETALIMGDTFNQVVPALGAIKAVTGLMKNMFPDIMMELVQIQDSLQMVIQQSISHIDVPVDEAMSDEARKILEEAATLAQQNLANQFPALPSFGVPASTPGAQEGQVTAK